MLWDDGSNGGGRAGRVASHQSWREGAVLGTPGHAAREVELPDQGGGGRSALGHGPDRPVLWARVAGQVVSDQFPDGELAVVTVERRPPHPSPAPRAGRSARRLA